jgi:hypothetical protein
MHESWPLTADSSLWAKPGYWDVGLIGDEMQASQTLCKPRLCMVVEPGEASDVTFNNLKKVTTIVGPNKRKILLSGKVAISGSAAIRAVAAAKVSDGYILDTPRPVAVTPGQQVRITITITMPRHA